MGYSAAVDFHVAGFSAPMTALTLLVRFKSNQRCPHSQFNSILHSCSMASKAEALSFAVVLARPALFLMVEISDWAPVMLFCCARASALIRYCSASLNMV